MRKKKKAYNLGFLIEYKKIKINLIIISFYRYAHYYHLSEMIIILLQYSLLLQDPIYMNEGWKTHTKSQRKLIKNRFKIFYCLEILYFLNASLSSSVGKNINPQISCYLTNVDYLLAFSLHQQYTHNLNNKSRISFFEYISKSVKKKELQEKLYLY